MQKRKVIVFGATGEIGGRVAAGCVRAGHQVYGVSRGRNQRERVDLAGVRMVPGDKSDETFLAELARLDYDAVIDSVPRIEDVDRYARHFTKAESVFLCSSTGTFVPLREFPADETHPWREQTPVNFYPQSMRDAHAFDLWQSRQFPVSIFRPTNIIGPGRIPLELWGGRNIEFFRRLKRHEPVRIPPVESILVQSGYHADLADAFVRALDFPDRVRGELFIISCRKAITLGTYLKTAMEHLGSHSEIVPTPPAELMRLQPDIKWTWGLEFLLEHMCFDIGKAERTFGYAPTRTAQQGLVEALEWCAASGLL